MKCLPENCARYRRKSAAFLPSASVVLARPLPARAPLLLASSSSLLRYGILLRGVDHAALAAA